MTSPRALRALRAPHATALVLALVAAGCGGSGPGGAAPRAGPLPYSAFDAAGDVIWFRETPRRFVAPSATPDGERFHWYVSRRVVKPSLDFVVVHPIGEPGNGGVPVYGHTLAGYRADGEKRTTDSGTWHRFRKLPFAETKERFEAASK